MLDTLRLVHYKGFERFTVHFRNPSLLVGPNNAGKSTIITALRVCASLVLQARRQKAVAPFRDETRQRNVRGFALSLPRIEFSDENIRHEFREEEARLELRSKNGATLYAVWPFDSSPYFYVEHLDGLQPSSARATKEHFETIGVVPTLSPLEQTESPLTPERIRSHYSSRLVSRHFRNQLRLMQIESSDDFDDTRSYILANTPEIESMELVAGQTLDLYFREAGARTERELCWAGDGLQIWIQVLFHIWRQRSNAIIVLDEPDVFLHPDLQRRLIRVLEEMPAQVILATHAPEMLAEASRESVIIVDRTRTRSRRISNEAVLSDLNQILGSGFNLKLARALRSRVALFVEGDDMKILKNTARIIGAVNVAKEIGLTIPPMGGASNRDLASSFGWLNEHLLDKAVQVAVFLDRDYLTDEMAHDIERKMNASDVRCHVWKRKELESYLLHPSLIARSSGAPETEVREILSAAVGNLYNTVFARSLEVRQRQEVGEKRHAVSVNEDYLKEFADRWTDPGWALYACPAKDVLSAVSRTLQERKYKVVSARGLSNRIRAHEVPAEMRDAILDIEARLVSPTID